MCDGTVSAHHQSIFDYLAAKYAYCLTFSSCARFNNYDTHQKAVGIFLVIEKEITPYLG